MDEAGLDSIQEEFFFDSSRTDTRNGHCLLYRELSSTLLSLSRNELEEQLTLGYIVDKDGQAQGGYAGMTNIACFLTHTNP